MPITEKSPAGQATLEGTSRIAKAAELVEVALSAPAVIDGVLDLSALETGATITPTGTDSRLRKRLLRALGVLDVTRGPGGPARLTATPRENAAETRRVADAVWQLLAARGTLTPQEVAACGNDPSKTDRADGAVWLLKELQLAAGVPRAGGLRLFEDFQRELIEAERGLAEAEHQIADGEASESRHEKVYYDGVALALRAFGFTAIVLGVRQRAAGEWNTPDVVGYYVQRSQSLVAPVVRLVTVEVKHALRRVAIAEAESHKRFSHYSFVAVPTPFPELERSLVAECVRKGLGLIAPATKGGPFEVQFEPPLHRADEEEVDAMLAGFRDERDVPLKSLVSRDVRAAFTTLLT